MEQLEPSARTSDLSCCFLFHGDTGASFGIYRPVSYELYFRGDDVAQHHVMHLHEIHHKALNDDTSWGSAVHIAARHPGWGDRLLALLIGNCRIVHEAFASFMSISLAGARHADVGTVLDHYPIYRPLARRLERLLAPIADSHRRDLAATGIARFCMNSPVLELLLDSYPRDLLLSDLPAAWLPDHRFGSFAGVSAQAVAEAATAADHAFRRSHSRDIESTAVDQTDEILDAAWQEWEDVFVAGLVAGDRRLSRLPLIAPNSHLPAAAALVVAAAANGVEIDLPHEAEEQDPLSDAESVQRLLTATRIPLREPYLSGLVTPGEGVDLTEVLDFCASLQPPHIVIHGRTTAQLQANFAFGPGDLRYLAERSPGPVFSVRTLTELDGADLVLQTELTDPELQTRVVEGWSDRGLAVNCITASCFLDVDWQSAWLPVLRTWPTVILIDVSLLAMIGPSHLLGDTQRVHTTSLGLGHPALSALVIHVEGHPHIMLSIGDDLTIQLLTGQLSDVVGSRLETEGADWSQWLEALSAVSASILGTEAALRFSAS